MIYRRKKFQLREFSTVILFENMGPAVHWLYMYMHSWQSKRTLRWPPVKNKLIGGAVPKRVERSRKWSSRVGFSNIIFWSLQWVYWTRISFKMEQNNLSLTQYQKTHFILAEYFICTNETESVPELVNRLYRIIPNWCPALITGGNQVY